jgi:hypothetical protein
LVTDLFCFLHSCEVPMCSTGLFNMLRIYQIARSLGGFISLRIKKPVRVWDSDSIFQSPTPGKIHY